MDILEMEKKPLDDATNKEKLYTDNDVETLQQEENQKSTIIDTETQQDEDQEAKNLALYNSVVKITGEDITPETCYRSDATFTDLELNDNQLKGIYAKNFTRPSAIQKTTIPVALKSNSNIIAQAHHGSGKTATFALIMLSKVDVTIQHVQAICISNTRELAIQIAQVVQEQGKFTNIRVHIAVGIDKKNISYKPNQQNQDEITDQIVVGTPGSIQSQFDKNCIQKKYIKLVVYDEADVQVNDENESRKQEQQTQNNNNNNNKESFNRGRGGAYRTKSLAAQAIGVRNKCAQNVQILLFSATFSPEVMKLAERVCPKAIKFKLEREKIMLDNIIRLTMHCTDEKDKQEQFKLLFSILTIKQVIIFCNAVASAKMLANNLRADSLDVSIIYGKMGISDREKAVRDFREGRTNVQISTNLLSRGFDVPNISFVVNYEIPVTLKKEPDPETYAHRIGRSGRFGRNGCAINFTDSLQSRTILQTIENTYKSNDTTAGDKTQMIEIPRDNIYVCETIFNAALNGTKLRPEDVKVE